MKMTHYNCDSAFLEASSEITIHNLLHWFYINDFEAISFEYRLILSTFNLKFINIKNFSRKGSTTEKYFGATAEFLNLKPLLNLRNI